MRLPPTVQNLDDKCSAFPEMSGTTYQTTLQHNSEYNGMSFRFVSVNVSGYMVGQN
jgi:hypothetical protein